MTSAYDSGTSSNAAPFVFSGRGSEYFRIWIVNLLLSLLTLGIYSAWAKVRRTRYFYDNASLAGSSFDYHGNPVAILKGRMIAVALIGLYQIAPRISAGFGVAMLFLLLAAAPWLIWKSLQFKLHNSSYRGIRFGMRGAAKTAYLVFLALPLLTLLSGFLLTPFTHQRIKRFQHNASRFGNTAFSFHATVGNFYRTYLLGVLIAVAGFIAIGLGFGGTLTGLVSAGRHYTPATIAATLLFFFALYAWVLVLSPLFLALLQNIIWSNTRLGPHRFKSRMKWSRMIWISLSNLVLVSVTLGLYLPFATIRTMRYRIESMTLLPASDLNEFIAGAEPAGSVTGEGIADLLDFDLSL